MTIPSGDTKGDFMTYLNSVPKTTNHGNCNLEDKQVFSTNYKYD